MTEPHNPKDPKRLNPYVLLRPPVDLFNRKQHYSTDQALLRTVEEEHTYETGEHADLLRFRPCAVGRVPGESELPLVQALGHVLAEDVCTRLPVPSWPLAKVTGQAICSAQWQQASQEKAIQIDETIFYRHGPNWSWPGFGLPSWAPPSPPKKRLAVKVRALRPMPFDTDAVLHAMSPFFRGAKLSQKESRRVIAPPPAGHDVIARGEHLPAGAPLLKRGQPLGPKELAMLGCSGISTVKVFNKPRVAVLIIHAHMRSPDHEALTGWLPDGMTPLIVGTLTQWGFPPEEVLTMPLDQTEGVGDAYALQIQAFRERFDVTFIYGADINAVDHIGNAQGIVYVGGAGGFLDESVDPNEGEDSDGALQDWYPLHAGQTRTLDRTTSDRRVYQDEPLPLSGKPLNYAALFEGCTSPLAVLIGLHLLFRPMLKALCGVGDFPLIDNPKRPGNVNASDTIPPQNPFLPPHYWPEQDGRVSINVNGRLVYLDLPPAPEAVKHFARGATEERWRRHLTPWFTGVLLNPAPRDAQRHWLQMATLDPQPDGRTGVRVLPTDEFQVARLNEAEAICLIDSGEGEFPPGTVVHYFLLD
jgi:molybdopterin biosynthesis enzyme